MYKHQKCSRFISSNKLFVYLYEFQLYTKIETKNCSSLELKCDKKNASRCTKESKPRNIKNLKPQKKIVMVATQRHNKKERYILLFYYFVRHLIQCLIPARGVVETMWDERVENKKFHLCKEYSECVDSIILGAEGAEKKIFLAAVNTFSS